MSRQIITDAQRRWLMAALGEWTADNLLSSAQAEGILARYETAEEVSRRKQSLAALVLQGMAALLVGLGALLLISFNWDAIPRSGKLVCMVTVVAVTHGLGFYLRGQLRMHRVSEVVFFLGCLLYGAGIWLVAQAFHLDAHYPDAVWWWAIGVLPFALCLDSLLCHLLFAALLALWAGMEVFGFSHLRHHLLAGWHWPNGVYSLLLLSLPGLVAAYRRGSVSRLAVYLPLVVWWLILQPVSWGMGSGRETLWIGSIGAILLALAEAHRPGNPLAIPYRIWGALLSAGVLIPLSSTWFWDQREWHRASGLSEAGEIAAVLLLLAFAFSTIWLVGNRRSQRSTWSEQWRRQWFPAGLAACLVFFTLCSLVVSDSAATWLLPVLLANGAMLALAVYLVRVGVREERVLPFGAGVLYFLIWAFARYIDLASETGGMLGAAVLFFLCAAALVVVARFWTRTRPGRDASGSPAIAPEPFVGPAWLDNAARWLSARTQPILLLTAGAQGLILIGMITLQAVPLAVGDTILLRVNPVDPRDLFRGDYVILDYDANRQVREFLREGKGGYRTLEDRPVYVALEPEEDGKHWRPVGASFEKPAQGKYLKGRYTGHYRQPVLFGIEAYYVQEGTGRELERMRNSDHLSAEIALAPWGQAKLRRLIPQN